MGCWNGTCAISNLPIQYGDRVKVVILKENRFKKELAPSSGYVYSNDLFNPAFLPITGIYNDYGCIENIEEDWNTGIIQVIFREKFEKLKLEGKVVTGEDITIDGILNAIERGEFEMLTEGDVKMKEMAEAVIGKHTQKELCMDDKTWKEWKDAADLDVSAKWRKAPYSFVMIRQDIWDTIVQKFNYGECYNDGPDRRERPYLTIREHYEQKFYDTVKSLRKKIKLSSLTREGINYLFDMAGFAGGGLFAYPEWYASALEHMVKQKKEDMMYNPWLEFRIVDTYMAHTRRGWIVQPGAGSQGDGWKDYKIVAEKIIEIVDEKIKEYEEED